MACASDFGDRFSASQRQALQRRRFDEIYRTRARDVARWVRALGAPQGDLEDLVQDVFVIVWRRLPEFDGKNVAGWLYRIARHRVRDFRRLGWVQRRDAGSTESLAAVRAVDNLAHRERVETIDTLLGCLNETERSALLLYELGGYSGREITRIQGAPLNTVWARLASARRKLRTQSAWEPDDDGLGRGPNQQHDSRAAPEHLTREKNLTALGPITTL